MDWVFHILVPLGLLALFGVKNKWVLLLLPLTVIPDIGSAVDFRRGLHSIFVFALLLLAVFVIARLKKPAEAKTIVGISAFYFATHLLLDIGGPMALFWPFSGEAFTVTIRIVIENLVPKFVFGINAVPIESLEQRIGSLIAEPGFGLLFAFLIILVSQRKAITQFFEAKPWQLKK